MMRRGIRQLPRYLVAVVLVVLLLRTVDLDRIGAIWSDPHWSYVGLAAAITFVLVALCVRRWQILLAAQGMPSRFGRLYVLYLAGVFLNHLLPTSIGGDVLKAYQVGRDHDRMSRSAATVFVDRFLGLSILVLLAVILYAIRLRNLGEAPIHVGFVVVVAGYAALLAGILLPRPVHWVATHIFRGRLPKLFELLDRWHRDVISFRRRPGALVHCFFLALAYHLLSVVHTFWILRIFTGAGSLGGVFVMLPGIFLTSVAPVSVGGIGVTEWAYLYFLNLMGVAAEAGVSVALFVRLKAVVVGAGGLLVFLLLRRRWDAGRQPAASPAGGNRASASLPDTITRIVEGDLCIRCGGCAAVCPPDNVITVDENGYPHVDYAGCIDCHLCLDVCPMDDMDVPQLYRQFLERDFAPQRDSYVGPYIRAYVGCSTDPAIRRRGSSGGVGVQLMISLLESGRIDAATAVVQDPQRPWDFTTRLARTREELLQSGGSKYTIVPLNEALRDFWKRGDRVALVALPCQLQSLRLWEGFNAKVRRNVELSVGLFCTTTLRKEGSKVLLDRAGIRPDEVARVDYRYDRSGDWPGGVHVELKSGEIRPLHQLNVKYGAFNYLGKSYHPTECLNCIDYTAELCDLTLADPWLRGPDGDYLYKGGWTLILSRTRKGDDLLHRMVRDGQLHLEEVEDEVFKLNFAGLAKDKYNYAHWRIARLARRGRPYPKFHTPEPHWDRRTRYRAWRYAAERIFGATELTRRIYIYTALSAPGVWVSRLKTIVKRGMFRRRWRKWQASRAARSLEAKERS
ncbi:MAG: flippase-like domain-containing protein [Candidatus Eisenbacteria bacterium]|nr:flippase-like domain-containing protein [Candidatus Eisenbacteria bacterium]